MGKLLTVIVPSYNMEKYLRACLDSVLSDNPMADRLDVIVVNDGSSDGTSAIAHEFEAAHPGTVRVIDKENGNYGSCVNAGLREAQGLYVKILDADDTFDTPAFGRYLRFLDGLAGESAPDVVFNDFVEVDPDGNVLKRHEYALVDEPDFTLARFDYQGDRCVWMHALAYRTELLRRIGYRQTEGISYTDQEWAVLPLLHVRTFQRCAETVYRYLVGRPGQTCDEAVRLKNFAMHFCVARSIIRSYERGKGLLPDTNLALAGNQIRKHLRFFFHTCLLSFPKQTNQTDLASFDEFLLGEAPDWFGYVDSFRTLFVRGFPFHFVREWRRKHTRRTAAFLLWDFFETCRKARRLVFPKSRRRSGILH